MSWRAIWNDGVPVRRSSVRDAPSLRALTLWLEVIAPARPRLRAGRLPAPLRLWQGAEAASRAIGLYLLPDGALRLVHGEIDLSTPPGFLRSGETLSLRYVACARGRADVLDLQNHDRGTRLKLRSGIPAAITIGDAMPRCRDFLKVAHVVAIADDAVAATDLPGVEAGALVLTTEGRRPVETLVPGMLVRAANGVAHPLRWIERRERLCLGRAAPILLRAPYFGLDRDLCVTPETRILRTGPEVDYLYGTEAVLLRAVDMTAGRAVQRSSSIPVRAFHHLMLDDPHCLMIDRCAIETACLGDVLSSTDEAMSASTAPDEAGAAFPVLDRAAARALVSANTRAAA